jgi:hypothetical protein
VAIALALMARGRERAGTAALVLGTLVVALGVGVYIDVLEGGVSRDLRSSCVVALRLGGQLELGLNRLEIIDPRPHFGPFLAVWSSLREKCVRSCSCRACRE